MVIVYLCQYLNNSLTDSCFVDLTDVTLAVEDSNTKLVDVVAFAGVDTKESVDDRLVTAECLAIASQVRQQLDNSFSTFS